MVNIPKERQQWILDELKLNPVLSYTDTFANYFVKFAKSKVTFDKDWLKANVTFQEYKIKVNNAKDKESINQELKAFKSGLKSKFERMMILQNEVDMSLVDLQGEELTTIEKVQLRKVVRELQSEISKIEGDYAAVKNESDIKISFED